MDRRDRGVNREEEGVREGSQVRSGGGGAEVKGDQKLRNKGDVKRGREGAEKEDERQEEKRIK